MSDVYFIPAEDIKKKFSQLASKVIVSRDGEFTAVKVHFGEQGNKTHVPPDFTRQVVSLIKEKGAKAFVTDTNALYKGMRHDSVDHLETASLHGFTHDLLGAPVIIADGLHGHNSGKVKIDKKHFKEVKIASEILAADSLMFLSHFKGHMSSGFGASIKNMAMGCASRAGKQQQHSGMKPEVDQEKCIACAKCQSHCPEDAISVQQYAVINPQKCVGCNECQLECPTQAIAVRWDSEKTEFSEKMAEYAYGAVLGKKAGYINFLTNITPHCDCLGSEQKPFAKDIGVLASLDPVALDQACLDLLYKDEPGAFEKLHNLDPTVQLRYAEEIGLGKREYKLIRI